MAQLKYNQLNHYSDTFYIYNTTLNTGGRFFSDYNVYANNLGTNRYGQCDEVHRNCGQNQNLLNDLNLDLTVESSVAINKGLAEGTLIANDPKIGQVYIPVEDMYYTIRKSADIGAY